MIFQPERFEDGVRDSEAVIPNVTDAGVSLISSDSCSSSDDDEEEEEVEREERLLLLLLEEESDGTFRPVVSVYKLAMAE